VLLERDSELNLLVGLLDEIPASGGKVVLLRGEAGIGKSALVRAFCDRVGSSAVVHLGYCDDLQTPQPFGPLWDISQRSPSLLRALREHNRQHVFDAVLELLGAGSQPTVLVIEDTHWSDEATLDAIRHTGRRIAGANGLLLITYRAGEVDVEHPLRRVIGDLSPHNIVRIELSGLSLAAVSTIVEGSGSDPERVLQMTRGNPFLVTEWAMSDGDEVPSSVRDSALARVARLSVPARDALFRMSVIPERIRREEATVLAGASNAELAACERFGLLDVSSEWVAFRHDLLRRAIEASMTVSEQVSTHKALLERLPSSADPVTVLHHARCANDVTRLVQFAPIAARTAAAVGSYREALAHFRSLKPQLERLPATDRGAVLRDWARVEYYLGRPEAIELIDEAIRHYRESGSDLELAGALTQATDIASGAGRFDRASEYAEAAIDILRPLGPTVDLVAALSSLAVAIIKYGDGPAAAYADEAIALAQSIGDELASITALHVKALLEYLHDKSGGRVLMEQVRVLAEQGELRFEEVTAVLGIGYVALEVRDLEQASDFFQRGRDTAIRYELAALETSANCGYAEVLLWTGQWSKAEDLATELLSTDADDSRLHSIIGTLRTRSGRDGGLEHLQRSWSSAARRGTDFLLRSATALAERSWLVGDVERSLVEGFADVLELGLTNGYPWPAGSLAYWLIQLEVITEVPRTVPQPFAAVLHGDFCEAARFWDLRRAPYERALALLTGDPASRLDALEVFETLGATAVAAKVRKDLKADGVQVTRGRGQATRRNTAGLTARQSEILQLLDESLTNAAIADRLFVSPRTVEHHVSALLAKLEVSSRAEAVLRARTDGLLAT
jgi:DNA-binding CsgD family transcriptional regulator